MNSRNDPHTCWTISVIVSCATKIFKCLTRFEPMTSMMPVQCPHQLSYGATQMWAGQFFQTNDKWKKCSCSGFIAQLVRALHCDHWDHGFKSRWRHLNFFCYLAMLFTSLDIPGAASNDFTNLWIYTILLTFLLNGEEDLINHWAKNTI